MTESMIYFQDVRRKELANGAPPATASTTGAIWNFTTPIKLKALSGNSHSATVGKMNTASVEQDMKDRYRAGRERLGMGFETKPVRVAIKRLAPPEETFDETPSQPVSVQTYWSMPAYPVAVFQIGSLPNDVSEESNYAINSRWRDIVKEVCDKHRVSPMEIRSRHREHSIVAARHEAFYRLRMETALSLPQIGKRMGGFDHSTCYNGIKKHQERMKIGAAL